MNTEMDILILENYFIFKEEKRKINEERNLLKNINKEKNKDGSNILKKKLNIIYRKNFISTSKKIEKIFVENNNKSHWINCKEK